MSDGLVVFGFFLSMCLVLAPLFGLWMLWSLKTKNAELGRALGHMEHRVAISEQRLVDLSRHLQELARRDAEARRSTTSTDSAATSAASTSASVASPITDSPITDSPITNSDSPITNSDSPITNSPITDYPITYSAAPPVTPEAPTAVLPSANGPGPAGHLEAAGFAPHTSPAVAPDTLQTPSIALGGAGVAASPPSPFDLEKLVGVRLFAWLGGVGLFIGMAFFLEYSIEHELIAPPLRVGTGLLTGALCLSLGDWLRKKADRAGQALGGAGIAILYAAIFAARSLYDLIPTAAAFLGMALVTVAAGVIAIARDAFLLSILGLMGGFATPLLLSTGEDHRYALFGYIALLDVGVLVVGAKKRWGSLSVLALLGSVLIYTGWSSEYLDSDSAPFALAVALLLAVLFVLRTVGTPLGEVPASPLARATPTAALAFPFVTALLLSGASVYVDVPLLGGYLVVLFLGTWQVAARWNDGVLLPAAAAMAVLTLTLRVQGDLFPDHRVSSLLFFSELSMASSLLYVARRRARDAASVGQAAAISLAGSFFVIAHALQFEGPDVGLVPFTLYGAGHVALLLVGGITASSAIVVALAQVLSLSILWAMSLHSGPGGLAQLAPLVVVSMLVFFGVPLTFRFAKRQSFAFIAGGAALVLHFALLYVLARDVWPDAVLGGCALVAAALALFSLSFARKSVPANATGTLVAALGGITLLFVSAAVPIALSKQWITVAWALEAASLAWLYRRLPHRGLLATSALMAAFATTRLIANPWLWEYHPRSTTMVLNWYLYTFGVPALAFLGAAHFLRDDPVATRYRVPLSLRLGGGVLFFVLLNVEIADAYSTGETIGFHLGASLVEDMTYSLAWGSFGLITLVLGIVLHASKARMSALFVLLLTIGKVFLHDLWHLGALYRVGSMVGLAISLLAVSFLTQRFLLRGDRT